jgi:hypothetical protein
MKVTWYTGFCGRTEHTGEVLEFFHTFFGGSKALIKETDVLTRIVVVDVEDLYVKNTGCQTQNK